MGRKGAVLFIIFCILATQTIAYAQDLRRDRFYLGGAFPSSSNKKTARTAVFLDQDPATGSADVIYNIEFPIDELPGITDQALLNSAGKNKPYWLFLTSAVTDPATPGVFVNRLIGVDPTGGKKVAVLTRNTGESLCEVSDKLALLALSNNSLYWVNSDLKMSPLLWRKIPRVHPIEKIRYLGLHQGKPRLVALTAMEILVFTIDPTSNKADVEWQSDYQNLDPAQASVSNSYYFWDVAGDNSKIWLAVEDHSSLGPAFNLIAMDPNTRKFSSRSQVAKIPQYPYQFRMYGTDPASGGVLVREGDELAHYDDSGNGLSTRTDAGKAFFNTTYAIKNRGAPSPLMTSAPQLNGEFYYEHPRPNISPQAATLLRPAPAVFAPKAYVNPHINPYDALLPEQYPEKFEAYLNLLFQKYNEQRQVKKISLEFETTAGKLPYLVRLFPDQDLGKFFRPPYLSAKELADFGLKLCGSDLEALDENKVISRSALIQAVIAKLKSNHSCEKSVLAP